MVRSKAAFLFSVRTFFERSERPYFWTFTFKECYSVEEALKRWNKFAKALWHFGKHPKTGEQTIVGLRCFELHLGGHGVHIHCLLNRWINIHILRRISHRYGFGRDHVVRIRSMDHAEKMAEYMAKYCSKQDRPPCFKGRRLWAAIGRWGASRCKDMEVESEFCTAYRARRRLIAAEARCADIEGRKYRIEHQLETMAWAKEHCYLVKIDRAQSLSGFIQTISDDPPCEADFTDWQNVWDGIGTNGYWKKGEWVPREQQLCEV